MEQVDYSHLIGKRVMKKSKKTFKSGEKIATVKGIMHHKHGFIAKQTNEKVHPLCFTFEEDDSHVVCEICVEVERGVELGSNVGIVAL